MISLGLLVVISNSMDRIKIGVRRRGESGVYKKKTLSTEESVSAWIFHSATIFAYTCSFATVRKTLLGYIPPVRVE